MAILLAFLGVLCLGRLSGLAVMRLDGSKAETLETELDLRDGRQFTIDAAVLAPNSVGSVDFAVDGVFERLENVWRFTINGNEGHFAKTDAWKHGEKHTISATAYSEDYRQGSILNTVQATFTIRRNDAVDEEPSLPTLSPPIQTEAPPLQTESPTLVTATPPPNEPHYVDVHVVEATSTGFTITQTLGTTSTVAVRDLGPFTLIAVPRADIGAVGSIGFYLDGTLIRGESVPPYVMTGDSNGIVNAWNVMPWMGTHDLEVKMFSGRGLSGFQLVQSCVFRITLSLNAVPETEMPVPATESPAPVTEAPATETPVTVAPATETPVTVAPATETPVTEAPVTEAPSREGVSHLLLVDAGTNMVVRRLAAVDAVNADLFSDGFAIVASTSGSVGSISFYLDGAFKVTENVAPYALAGDSAGDFNAWQFGAPRRITVGAQAFSAAHSSGSNVGTLVQSNVNIFRAGSPNAPTQPPQPTSPPSINPEIRFHSAEVSVGVTEPQSVSESGLVVTNPSLVPVHIKSVQFNRVKNGDGAPFKLQVQNTIISFGSTQAVDIVLPSRSSLLIGIQFAPTHIGENKVCVSLTGTFPTKEACIHGNAEVFTDDHKLHPIIDSTSVVVDMDRVGSQPLVLDASASHTHENGKSIVEMTWEVDFQPLYSSYNQQRVTTVLSLGYHFITLRIGDGSKTESATKLVQVVDPISVPGAVARLYRVSNIKSAVSALPSTLSAPSESLFDASTLLHVDLLDAVSLFHDSNQHLGTSSVSDNTVSVIGTQLLFAKGSYSIQIKASDGVDCRLFFRQAAVDSGKHSLEGSYDTALVCSIPSGSTDVFMELQIDGVVANAAASTFSPWVMTRDHLALAASPFINEVIPTQGGHAGGYTVSIYGVGFVEPRVQWDGVEFSAAQLMDDSFTMLQILAPRGVAQSAVELRVDTSTGTSNAASFAYTSTEPVQVKFDYRTLNNYGILDSTQGAFGADNRFYVGSQSGKIHALTFDANFDIVDTEVIDVLYKSDYEEKTIIGVCFSPFDGSLYITHSKLDKFKGKWPKEYFAYLGRVSRIETNPWRLVNIVSNLPVSNHDHAPNSCMFTDEGKLLVAVGSNTNAGIPHVNSGGTPESPLSAALVAFDIYNPAFQGHIQYRHRQTGLIDNDQRNGGDVDLDSSVVGVQVYAKGLRNAFGCVVTTSNRIWCTDNGPNKGYGKASVGPGEASYSDVGDEDEICEIDQGAYYGHPNPNRAAHDEREWEYFGVSSNPDSQKYTQCIKVQSALVGITEYTSFHFGAALRGDLFAQKWKHNVIRVEMPSRDSGKYDLLRDLKGLDLKTGPGGAFYGVVWASYGQEGRIKMAIPDDDSLKGSSPMAVDVFPFRCAPHVHCTVIITGINLSNVNTVTVAGASLDIQTRQGSRLVGRLRDPPASYVDGTFYDVTLSFSNTLTLVVPNAFKWVTLTAPPVVPNPPRANRWISYGVMPVELGEVAGGAIGRYLYLFGEAHRSKPEVQDKTYRFDLETKEWRDDLAKRPFSGTHHAAEVVNGKLYVFGGLKGGEGQVQIYDPVLDVWSVGSPMPWSGGSVNAARVGTSIMVCGGIVGSKTVGNTAVYSTGSNTWTSRVSMPVGRNHAAVASDGDRVWVFGGRTGGNSVNNGFDDVQVYSPSTNTWTHSQTSALKPMPFRRGGMGRAVFFNGNMYVMGGETKSDAGATNNGVYDRVDIYSIESNSWSTGAPMPTARHGIFPILHGSRVYVIAGGDKAGYAFSDKVEVYSV